MIFLLVVKLLQFITVHTGLCDVCDLWNSSRSVVFLWQEKAFSCEENSFEMVEVLKYVA